MPVIYVTVYYVVHMPEPLPRKTRLCAPRKTTPPPYIIRSTSPVYYDPYRRNLVTHNCLLLHIPFLASRNRLRHTPLLHNRKRCSHKAKDQVDFRIARFGVTHVLKPLSVGQPKVKTRSCMYERLRFQS